MTGTRKCRRHTFQPGEYLPNIQISNTKPTGPAATKPSNGLLLAKIARPQPKISDVEKRGRSITRRKAPNSNAPPSIAIAPPQ